MTQDGRAETLLQRRIRQRLEELRRTAREVSLSAGLKADAIRTILTGRSVNPRADTMRALAAELQCDVGYLLGEQDVPIASSTPTRHPDGTLTGVLPLGVMFNLSAEWVDWRELSLIGDDDYIKSDVFSLPDYRPGSQNLARVSDHHANQIAPQGSYIHYLSLTATRPLDLRDRDLVVLRRSKFADDRQTVVHQLSVRRVRLSPSGVVLELPSTVIADDVTIDRPTLAGIVGMSGSNAPRSSELLGSLEFVGTGPDDRQALSIESLVLRVIVPVSGPPVERGRTLHEDEPETA